MSASVAKLIGLALLALLSTAVALPATAAAQDIIEQKSRRIESVVGPYTVAAEAKSLPSLQSAQFIIRVRETAPNTPADDVTVTILTTWSGSDETGHNIALSPNIPGLYTATLKFKPGRWETTFLIEPPDGGSYGVDGFVFQVPQPSSNTEAGFVFLGVFLVLLAGGGYLVWRIRRTQRQRRAASGEPAS